MMHTYNSSLDQDMQKAVQEAMQRHQEKWADEQAAKTPSRLENAIAQAKSVAASPRLRSVLNIRHKHLVHSLTETSLERKGSVHPMNYGDEPCTLASMVPRSCGKTPAGLPAGTPKHFGNPARSR